MRPVLFALLLAWPLAAADPPDFWTRVHATVEKYLGRPYVWGASGIKSFDCSGFVWRVNYENGIFMKRTTARKYYFSLPAVGPGDESKFGTMVFFDNLRHCGIVNDAGTFYHAQTSVGTNLSHFDPHWRPLVCGYRRISR